MGRCLALERDPSYIRPDISACFCRLHGKVSLVRGAELTKALAGEK